MGSLFKWNENFLTGIDAIDDQHLRLHDLIDALSSTLVPTIDDGRVGYAKARDAMAEWARGHFSDEEALMERAGIDARFLQAHKAQHRYFMEEVANLTEDRSTESLQAGLTYLQSWLMHHILDIDKSMTRQLESIGHGASGSDAYAAELSRRRGLTDPLLTHFRDEHREAEQRIRRLAYFDALTGLPNRTRFIEAIQQAMSRGPRHPVALLLLDIDRFKEVNDTLGHSHGDALLRQVAARLDEAMYPGETVARVGGDEFGVLSDVHVAEDVDHLVGRICAALHAPVSIEGIPIVVEASIGVALAPQHAPDAGRMLQRADVAMYHAKATGSGHAIYDPGFDSHSPGRLALLGELRHAIQAGELVLHYQPKIELRSGRVVGAEALVRWRHPSRGMVPPDDFILIAERTGLIKPLTEWVLREALRQCAVWRREGGPTSVAVNLSARSLYDPHLPQSVEEALQDCGLPADALELEITESAIIVDPARAASILHRLVALGIRISVDDFGTGYTSLRAIRTLPAHEIKIDRSFVACMTGKDDDDVITRIIVDLGHNLGLKVVAEGIESTAAARRLRELGCDSGQGFLISRPLPALEFAEWYAGYLPFLHQ